MSNCNYEIQLNNETYSFDDLKKLENFISNNFYRIKGLDYGSLISESVSGVNKFEESKAKLDMVIKESEGFTSDFNEHGERMIVGKGFTGVNKLLNSDLAKTEDGKQLISQYNEDEFIKNRIPIEVGKLQNDPAYKDSSEDVLKKIAEQNVLKLVEEAKMLGTFGTEFHYISELFFKGVTNIADITTQLKVKFPERIFNDNAVKKMLDYVIDITNKIKSTHGETALIYPEFVVHDPESKIVGIIDLLVLDENGKTHIYDYKFSHKKVSEWSKVKLNKMKYQMAFYNQLLMKKGLLTNSINLLPIDINSIDYENKIINDIDTDQSPLDITSDIYKTYYQYEANRFVPVSFSDFLEESVVDKDIKDELMKSFGYSIQTNLDIEGFKPIKGENGKEYFKDRTNDKIVYLDGTPEENQQKIDEYKKRYLASENHELSMIVDKINKFFKTDDSSGERMYYDEARQNSFYNIFKYYKNKEWKMINDKDLMALGIVAFENIMTGSIDFISFTSHDLNHKIKLNKGTTILGNFLDDRFLISEKGLLDSSVKNIEGLKIAMWINSKADLFNTGKYSIGEMRVATINMRNIQGVNADEIISNYGRLVKHSGQKINIKTLNYTNPYNLILSKVISLLNNTNEIFDGGSKYVIKKIGKEIEGEEISYTRFENLTAEQKLEKLDLLKKLQKEMTIIDKTKLDINNEMHALYYLIEKAIAYYNGIEIGYVEDLKNAALNESKQFSSPQNISNETVKSFYKVFKRASDSIGRLFNIEDEKINKYLLKYFEEIGFTRSSQVIKGAVAPIYKNLWELKDGKLSPDFRVKNPFDRNTDLSDSERTFLINLLETFASFKYKDQKEIDEAINNGDYFKIPLIKAKGINRLKQKGIINTAKNSLLNAINFNNYFQNESEENRSSMTKRENMFNQFNLQRHGSMREDMLKEFGTDEFEQDLQTIVKTYVLSHIREKEFNKALPLVNSIRTVNFIKNSGFAKSVVQNLDAFMDDYIRSVIFNEKLIEPHHEKYVRFAAKVKEVTSVGLLGYNFSGGVRDFFQGMINNLINVNASSFGYKLDPNALYEAYQILTKESVNYGKNINLIDMINSRYMMSFRDINLLAEQSMVGQNGIFTFRSEQMYMANQIADFQNRMSLFLAKMIEDGSYAAHSLKDNKLVYDWKMDDRFNVYSKGPSMKNHPDYKKQEGLYISMIRDLNEQQVTDVPLKIGDDLPQAYTSQEIEGIKRLANLLHGYYDQDSKMLWQSTWLGISVIQFRSWLKAKVDQYVLDRRTYNTGKRVQMVHPVTKEPQFYDRDENGNLFVTSKDTGTPVYIVEETLMEGMLTSFLNAAKTLHECKYNVKEFGKILKEDDLMKGNLKALSYDLSVYAIVTALVASIDWPEFKKDAPLLANLAKTTSRAVDDLYFVNNVKMVMDPESFIPSVSYAFDTMDTLSGVLIDPVRTVQKLMNQTGMLRPISYVLDEE